MPITPRLNPAVESFSEIRTKVNLPIDTWLQTKYRTIVSLRSEVGYGRSTVPNSDPALEDFLSQPIAPGIRYVRGYWHFSPGRRSISV
jgi:hypothetical protein